MKRDKEGLSIRQRGKNPFGLDHNVNYEELYGSQENAREFIKKPCIHLAPDLNNAQLYKKEIEMAYSVDVVILEIELDPDLFDLASDPEAEGCFLCFEDIPFDRITLLDLDYDDESSNGSSMEYSDDDGEEEYSSSSYSPKNSSYWLGLALLYPS